MRLAILGAGGHGAVIADSAEGRGWTVNFFDDSRAGAFVDWEITGTSSQLLEQVEHFDGVIVGIGANAVRLEWLARLRDAGATFATIIDRTAVVSRHAKIGQACFLAAGSIVNIFACIEDGCIINTGTTVDHDCHVAEGVHLSPGVHLSGGVNIGRASWLGTGTVVRNNITVGDYVIAGVGSAITKDIASSQIVVGVPARPFKGV
ncbi:acetyltransferase [Bradyrhizobium sp. WSM4349]|uniref:acetyltransferase n=1 Tax=Bradyrhizobium sp. WSM4349 TaxID=1040988 RepID=UPI000376D2A8|nr:acetyltransferase [Bradyrhizobium sp. WSM4349]